jgi:RNA polymerase sigma-70 factor (family 1)
MAEARTYSSDDLLFNDLHAGKEEAFNTFYHRYFFSVLYFSRRYVQEAEAEDITTEAFVQTWQQRDQFDSFTKLTNYLYVVARNKCQDVLRKMQVRAEHAVALAQLQEQSTGIIESEQVRAEMINLLYAQLHQLPAKTREVFLLSFQQGLKPAQIAEQLGLSVQTVKNQKVTAIRLLKAALKGHPLEAVLLFLLFH